MKVDSQRLKEQAADLRTVESQLQDIRATVLQVACRLCDESFADEFREPLQRITTSMGRQCGDVATLRSALFQIADLYEDREQRIVDEVEQASVHHEPRRFNWIDFGGITWIVPQVFWTTGDAS